MRKVLFSIILLLSIFFIFCASEKTASNTEGKPLEEPIDNDAILIIGCLFAENMGIDEQYESMEENVEVVLVGKSIVNDKEVVNGYHIRTDENGYFFLSNVPKGSYVIKGARLFVANSFEINVISDWRTNEISFYVPYLQEELIRHDVKYFPAPPKGRVYDFGITFFGINKGKDESGPQGVANSVLYQHYRSIENQKLTIGKKYTKPSPLEYFKKKFPNSKWFTLAE